MTVLDARIRVAGEELANDLKNLPYVMAVAHVKGEYAFNIVTLVSELNQEIVDAIYDKEARLISKHGVPLALHVNLCDDGAAELPNRTYFYRRPR